MMQIVMPSLHAGQMKVHKHAARFKVLACGRRWGKTRLGTAECISVGLGGGRAWWIAPSYKIGAIGWRGLLYLSNQIPGANSNKAERLIKLPTGGEVQVRSADDPQSLRGEGLDLAVFDEFAYIKPEAWTEAVRPTLSDRIGAAMFISTPHGLNHFRDLWLRGRSADFPDWQSWTFKTSSNPYISKAELDTARRELTDRVYRQEYEADFLEDNPGALWRREWIDDNRVLKAPGLARVVVSVDPPAFKHGDACGIVGAGMAKVDADRHLYVLADETLNGTPNEWGRAAVAMYHRLGAGLMVAESNQGGQMVEHTIKTIDRSVNVKLIHAHRGKAVRAEPVSAIYQQGRGHHVGTFALLEDELCQWEPGDASPNRLDALVQGSIELIPSNSGGWFV